MVVVLKYVGGQFVENANDNGDATLEITPESGGGVARLTFMEGVGLITRRTASRQAESVCKSGFLLKSGERVGVGLTLEIVDGDKLNEAHYRVGHSYNSS